MNRRLFFGFDVDAPWVERKFPGKIISPDQRHMTLAFLGSCDFEALQEKLNNIVLPPFFVGKVGFFDKCLFLPEKHPHVVSYHIQWLDGEEVEGYQTELVKQLNQNGLPVVNGDRKFLPHVTVCRNPEDTQAWEKAFRKIPMITKGLHLYESLGNSSYKILWTHAFYPPFEEIEHTADLAFLIHGKTFMDIFSHAQIALAFHYPYMLDFYTKKACRNIEEVMMELNDRIRKVDMERSCPFKAVSLHGKVQKDERELLHWEMVVDV